MKARVFGDGPAGWLAALVLANAGWYVLVEGRPTTRAAQSAHIHIISSDIINLALKADPALATSLTRVSRDDWCWRLFEDNGASCQRIRGFRISRADVINAIKIRAIAAGVVAEFHESQSVDYASGVDLVVDATGAARQILHRADRDQDIELTIDETGAVESYQTWGWEVEHHGSRSGTYKQRIAHDLQYFYFEHDQQFARLTHIKSADQHHKRADFPQDILAAICPDAFPSYLSFGLPKRSSQFALPIRRCLIENARGRHLPIIAFGDALIHTSPRQGFGITSIFHQANILAQSLNDGGSVSDIRTALEEYAENLWLGASIAQIPEWNEIHL